MIQLELFGRHAAKKTRRPASSSPVAPRRAAEQKLVAVLEAALVPGSHCYSSAYVRRLMTPLPRITAFDEPKRRRRPKPAQKFMLPLEPR